MKNSKLKPSLGTLNAELSQLFKAPKVVLRRAYFKCTKCDKIKPAASFGKFRQMANGDLRNQAQCIECR